LAAVKHKDLQPIRAHLSQVPRRPLPKAVVDIDL
jgi:hypothetical protein